jgi:hypothetical protein
MKQTVCLDFDGVVARYNGWRGEFTLGVPLPGAREFIVRLLELNYQVVIHTTRKSRVVQQWLHEQDFPSQVEVMQEKPPALVYIDDRGFRFTGDWEAAFQSVTMAPWWQ